MESLQHVSVNMSQNKTRVPGLEPENSNFYGGQQQPSGSFYARRSGSSSRGTVVPGMETANRSDVDNGVNINAAPQSTGRPLLLGKPVVGFLYSISRTPAGEFWPLQIGPNKIGTSPSSDIILPEGTVSQEHAVLVVRKLKSSGNVIASITDAQSTNGTMLNGESLGFNPVECHNGDKIVVGENYELVLILIDAAKMELSVSEDFISIENDTEDGFVEPGPVNGFTQNGTNGYNNSTIGGGPVPPPFSGGYTGGGTVGLDGSSGMNNKGGTKSL